MQDQILDMLLKKDEITWQNIIYDLIKTEQMDPWDVDIGLLANKYLETIKKLKEINFLISGKVVLAAALLLKIKSNKLVTEDLANFDAYLFNQEEEFGDLLEDTEVIRPNVEIPKLAIKTPQARKKKLSVNDLINALQKALEVNKRKVLRKQEEENFKAPQIPERRMDINKLIKEVYERILNFFKVKERVMFDDLVRSDRKEDKIATFIPLLHLDNQEKISLIQEKQFGDIEILRFK